MAEIGAAFVTVDPEATMNADLDTLCTVDYRPADDPLDIDAHRDRLGVEPICRELEVSVERRIRVGFGHCLTPRHAARRLMWERRS